VHSACIYAHACLCARVCSSMGTACGTCVLLISVGPSIALSYTTSSSWGGHNVQQAHSHACLPAPVHLASVGVGPSIGHRQDAWPVMAQRLVELIRELTTPDALTTRAVTCATTCNIKCAPHVTQNRGNCLRCYHHPCRYLCHATCSSKQSVHCSDPKERELPHVL
jgi:hypothetical protein